LGGTLGANRLRLFEWKPRAVCARNGSRPDHPLHPAFIAKNEAASAWIVEKQSATAAAAWGLYGVDIISRTPVFGLPAWIFPTATGWKAWKTAPTILFIDRKNSPSA